MAALLASPDGRRSASPTAGIIDTDIEYRRPLSRRNSFLNLQYSSWNSLRNLAISWVKSKDGASMSKSTGGNRGRAPGGRRKSQRIEVATVPFRSSLQNKSEAVPLRPE